MEGRKSVPIEGPYLCGPFASSPGSQACLLPLSLPPKTAGAKPIKCEDGRQHPAVSLATSGKWEMAGAFGQCTSREEAGGREVRAAAALSTDTLGPDLRSHLPEFVP